MTALTVTPLIETLAEMARSEYASNPGVEAIAETIFEMENGDEIVLEAKAKPTVKGDAKLYFAVDNQLIAKARLGEFLLSLGVIEADKPASAPVSEANTELSEDAIQALCDEAGIANSPENADEIALLIEMEKERAMSGEATLAEVKF